MIKKILPKPSFWIWSLSKLLNRCINNVDSTYRGNRKFFFCIGIRETSKKPLGNPNKKEKIILFKKIVHHKKDNFKL
jgi:hypothetical protein